MGSDVDTHVLAKLMRSLCNLYSYILNIYPGSAFWRCDGFKSWRQSMHFWLIVILLFGDVRINFVDVHVKGFCQISYSFYCCFLSYAKNKIVLLYYYFIIIISALNNLTVGLLVWWLCHHGYMTDQSCTTFKMWRFYKNKNNKIITLLYIYCNHLLHFNLN